MELAMQGSTSRADDAGEHRRLTAELETLLLREIALEYAGLNRSYFKGALRAPAFELGDAGGRLGRFSAERRSIEISRRLASVGWGTVVEVLKHEMAHQYVLEVLRIDDETSHGPAFRAICERLAIDARATGMPEPKDERGPDELRILERVAKLLALAESKSEHEAETAMKLAQRLMLKYNLENVSTGRARAYAYRHLGAPTGRVNEAERMIAVILGEHFFVDVIWVPVYRALEGKRGSVLEVCGTPANLEMAAYVYDFLRHAGERLWREHQERTGTRKNRDRRAFLAGVMTGFYAKLNAERKQQSKEGLVWIGDADLRSYYRKRHPYITRARYAGTARNEAHSHGREAGKRLVLHRPVGSGPSGRTLLLKG
jgi:hypothetical protein